MEIREADYSDIDVITSIYINHLERKYYREEDISLEEIKSYWKNYIDNYHVYVAYSDITCVGFCAFKEYEKSIIIDGIYINKMIKGLNTCFKLVSMVGEYAYGHRFSSMIAYVDGHESYVKDLYLALGARCDGFCGLNYTYYERLVWDDLSFFR